MISERRRVKSGLINYYVQKYISFNFAEILTFGFNISLIVKFVFFADVDRKILFI